MNNFRDTRLLEAFEYIDPKYIAEVGAGLKLRSVYSAEEEYAKPTLRTHVKQLTALAACVLLLVLAMPLFSHLPEIINSFAAGWVGGVTTEMSDASSECLNNDTTVTDECITEDLVENTEVITTEDVVETEDVISDFWKNSMVFSFPTEMTPKQIYDEVSKGGWVVENADHVSDFDAGADLWYDFFDKSNRGEPASVLVADYNGGVYVFDVDLSIQSNIFLTEIVYDGNVYRFIKYDFRNHKVLDSGEYKYLIADIFEYDHLTSRGRMETYFLTDDNTWTYREYLHSQLCNEPIHSHQRKFDQECELMIDHTIHYDASVSLPSGDYPFLYQPY